MLIELPPGLPLGDAVQTDFTSNILWDDDSQILWDDGSVILWGEAVASPQVIELKG